MLDHDPKDDLEEDPDGLEDDEAEGEPEAEEVDAEDSPDKPDPRDAEIQLLREQNERLQRMTAGGGYREIQDAPAEDELSPADIAALEASDDPRDKALLRLARRTAASERKLAMIEEAQDLGASPADVTKMRKLIESGHAGSMAGAKLILKGIAAEKAERQPAAKPKSVPAATVKAPKVPASREVLREAASRAAQLRRSPGSPGSVGAGRGAAEGGEREYTPPTDSGGTVRVVKASEWQSKLNGPKGREWLRAERAGRVRVERD